MSLLIYYFLKLPDIRRTISVLSKDERELLETKWNKRTRKQFVYYLPKECTSEGMKMPVIPSFYTKFVPRMVKEILIFVDIDDIPGQNSFPLAEYIANFIVQLPAYFDNKRVCIEVRAWDRFDYLNLDNFATILMDKRPNLVFEYFSIRGHSH